MAPRLTNLLSAPNTAPLTLRKMFLHSLARPNRLRQTSPHCLHLSHESCAQTLLRSATFSAAPKLSTRKKSSTDSPQVRVFTKGPHAASPAPPSSPEL